MQKHIFPLERQGSGAGLHKRARQIFPIGKLLGWKFGLARIRNCKVMGARAKKNICKLRDGSVKTDFSPAEPSANYPANPPAGGLWPRNPDLRLFPNIRLEPEVRLNCRIFDQICHIKVQICHSTIEKLNFHTKFSFYCLKICLGVQIKFHPPAIYQRFGL